MTRPLRPPACIIQPLVLCLGLFFLNACGSVKALSDEPAIQTGLNEQGQFTSFDGKQFKSLKWLPKQADPELVIIGVHGINGAADDWHVLGEFLQKENKPYALYAYDLRGMGRDPIAEDRGDLIDRDDWSRDLTLFNQAVRQRHPKANVVWFGESLGTLILMRTLDHAPPGAPTCDAVGLSAPICGLEDRVPLWQKALIRSSAWLFPKWRVSLESLNQDGHKIEVVEGVDHTEQANTNEWHVPRHTLRMLLHIDALSRKMPDRVARLKQPALVMHGGKDLFVPAAAARELLKHFPKNIELTPHFYPEGFHLLFYGKNNQQVCQDAAQWLDSLSP